MQKEVKAERWASLSAVRCLNLALSCQTNSTRSPISDFGFNPNNLASVNRSSARADGEAAASSLHQAGHAASIACSLRPALLRSAFSFLAAGSKFRLLSAIIVLRECLPTAGHSYSDAFGRRSKTMASMLVSFLDSRFHVHRERCRAT